jgi:hypothetical protein
VVATDLTAVPELSEALHETLLGDLVRPDRVAEARGRLRRGETPADDVLAWAIMASAQG